MARNLSNAGISTFLVPDSSVHAVMSRVNKVILGAHAILANGGMFAITGSLVAATAAQAHSTPVVVCAGQSKLTPRWNLNHDYGALDFADPSAVLGFDEGALLDNVEVVNPSFDYVNPELLHVFITNELSRMPSPHDAFLYRQTLTPFQRRPPAFINLSVRICFRLRTEEDSSNSSVYPTG